MKVKCLIITFLLLIFSIRQIKPADIQYSDSIPFKEVISEVYAEMGDTLSLDSLIAKYAIDSLLILPQNHLNDSLAALAINEDSISTAVYKEKEIEELDPVVLSGNPFFIDLVYMGYPLDFNWIDNEKDCSIFYGCEKKSLFDWKYIEEDSRTANQILYDLRADMRNTITTQNADLYVTVFDKLPNIDGITNYRVEAPAIQAIDIVPIRPFNFDDKLKIQAIELKKWIWEVNTLFQITGNAISENWHKGGNSNLSTLTVVGAKLNFDNKKNMIWENKGEWKMGVYSVLNDTSALRKFNFNDDILDLSSKLGVKAGGNWYYSALLKFSTQFFRNYKSVNDTILKTALFAPVKFEFGIGMDYKYKKILSVMFAPVSYRYIYVNKRDGVNPNLFGIETGKNELSEIGSSVEVQFNYSPIKDVRLESKFSFYTNYNKMLVDWETICNFTINRFTSTRLVFNPRYDSTVIYKGAEKAKIQYRSLMSVGFSHRFH